MPRSAAGNNKVITTRWIDIDKGDDENPNYRARLVGREIKTDERLDLFVATPPLESLRYIVSKCATNQSGSGRYCMLSSDIKRAYFYAKAVRPVFIEIPIEDRKPGDEGKVGRLNLSLYGTRDAAQNWQKEYTGYMTALGFKVGKGSPCNFYHSRLDITCTVHGDDFTSCGPENAIEWFKAKISAKYESKHSILGPGNKHEKTIRVLNRVLPWTRDGIQYEADQRHADLVIEELGLKDSKPVSTPGSKEDVERMLLDLGPPLNPQASTQYRGMAARLNYLALDRSDIQFATKEASK